MTSAGIREWRQQPPAPKVAVDNRPRGRASAPKNLAEETECADRSAYERQFHFALVRHHSVNLPFVANGQELARFVLSGPGDCIARNCRRSQS